MTRRAPWIWLAILVALWAVLALCVHWEPVLRDGWTNLNWHRWRGRDLTLAGVWELADTSWHHANPRLGQTLTTLLYAKGPYHTIVTPLLQLALFWLLATMALGRWPSLRRRDDALVFVTVVAITAICTPQFGPMLFYRPYFGNYTFGLALNLLWLVPYRLQLATPRAWRWWWAPLFVALGVAAGLCNEHTGPAFLAAGAAVTVYAVRRGDGLRPWMLAGLVGLAVGYALLMTAPGHAERYNGLAQQAGMLERVVERGVVANLRIVWRLVTALGWALPWIALGLIGRFTAKPAVVARETRLAWFGLACAGVLTTLALLASPKIGPRLFVHSVALCAIAITGWTIAQLATRRLTIACGLLSGGVLVYVALRCVTIYAEVGPVGVRRLALIDAGPLRTTVTIPTYPVGPSNWFLGEDLAAAHLRAAVAADHGLTGVELGK